MEKARGAGKGLILALLLASAPACGANAGTEENRACAPAACSDVDGAAGTTGSGAADAGLSKDATPTEIIVLPCTLCVRAEACCKAEGLTDCGYTAACTSAPTAQQVEFYLALCRAVLESSAAGSKTPPGGCR
jgi:hypothetical protein